MKSLQYLIAPKRVYLLLLIACLTVWMSLAHAAVDPKSILPPEQAYQPQLVAAEEGVSIQFNIAAGYYLYQQKLHFVSDGPSLGRPEFSPAIKQSDEFFGEQWVYFNTAQINIPYRNTSNKPSSYRLALEYQGCAEVGICYPPTRAEFVVDKTGLIAPQQRGNINVFSNTPQQSLPTALTVDTPTSKRWDLSRGSLWQNLLAFFIAGIGLSLTACMYPLLPIVSAIVVADRQSKRQAFVLSLVYVQGLALSYTLVGVLAGLTGALLTVWLQQAWVVLTASALLVVLALAMFGLIQIQLPNRVQSYFQQQSSRLSGGKIASVLGMGMLSALIVGPCVAPPLAFALGYIAQHGNAWLGGGALYMMALGTGVPLILAATFGAQILPKAGAWMNSVKVVFGVLLLTAALYLARAFLPYWLSVTGYAILLMGSGMYAIARSLTLRARHQWLPVILGIALMGNSGYFATESLRGNSTALHQALSLQPPNQTHFGRQFTDVQALQDAIKQAFADDASSPVIIDFYADWCVTCIQMQMHTFTDAQVIAAVDENRFFTIDVTANTREHQALLKEYGLFGPPGIFKLNAAGKRSLALLGFANANEFLAWLQRADDELRQQQ